MDIAALRAQAKHIQPIVRIGKGGISDSLLAEIGKQLKKRKLIKVRFLQSFVGLYDTRDAADRITEETGSRIIHQVGNTVVLYHE